MTADEFTAAIQNNWYPSAGWTRLVEQLRLLDGQQLFELLFPMATSAQWDCPGAFSAARALYEVSPKCPISCQDAVMRLLDTWDVSVEEVPWYLRDQFGRQTLLAAIEELRSESISDSQKQLLGTVCYWLDLRDPYRTA